MGMFENGANIPYFSPSTRYYQRIEKIDLQSKLNSQISGQSYNTKVTFYPDQTINICFSKNDIFGFQSAVCGSSSNSLLSSLMQKGEFERKLHYQHLKVLDVISSSFDSVNDYLTFKKLERENNKPELDSKEIEFLKSIRNSIRLDNLKKTKEKIFDFVMCNEWTYFFTGTFDPKKIDSFSPDKIKKVLKKWLENLVQRYGISYIIIFEHHKKGGIHIHGLIRENCVTPLKLVDSGTKTYFGFKKPMYDNTAIKHGLSPDLGKTVYNLKTWRFGWSTAIKVYGSQSAIARYVTKYITKSNKKIMGRYFWHSRDLDKPNVFYLNTNYDELQLPTYHGFKYLYHPSTENTLLQKYIDIINYDSEDKENNTDSELLEGWVDL